ncbi:MAG TPA: carboxypeptidase-like regulatory domain-containing protein, partial [Planctomycetota bacterium]|nr:carboxypeptidase-like regulatory domain-containing protein [Planctomycetota bacterium]
VGLAWWMVRAMDGPRPVDVAERTSGVASSDAPSSHRAPSAAEDPPSIAEATPSPDSVSEPDDEPATVSVRGQVIDSAGSSIAEADVILAILPGADESGAGTIYALLDDDYWRADQLHATTTDEDGAFAFTGLPPSRAVTIAAWADGEYGREELSYDEDATAREGVIVQTSPGKVLRGIVLDEKAEPVGDAVVSAYHSYSERRVARQGGFARTGPDGGFAIGMPGDATQCTLRVSSISRGQRFFTEVEVAEDEVVLRFPEMATIRGRITWISGEPASGLMVRADAEVTEPSVLQGYSGIRPQMVVRAVIDENGDYECRGIHPGFLYHVTVADPADGGQALTPRWGNAFNLGPGETAEWSRVLSRTITLEGRVLTAESRSPVANARIVVTKEGEAIDTGPVMTDRNGNYELLITFGPGRYRIAAAPRVPFAGETEIFSSPFAVEVDLADGETRALDLDVPEPILVPIVVVDANGNPLESIVSSLSFEIPGGGRYEITDSQSLDPTGRHVFQVFHPLERLVIDISAFPVGPIERQVYTLPEGAIVEERTIVIDPTAEIAGRVLDASGSPITNATVNIEVLTIDRRADSFGVVTDDDGRFEKADRLRAVPATITLRVRGRDGSWTSGVIHPEPGGRVDLGDVLIVE